MLIPPDDPPALRRRRIWRGIARELLAFVLLTLFAPLLLLCAVPVDLALWLLRRKPWMSVRVLAISGGGRVEAEEYLSVARKFGAVEVLPKPFTGQELKKAVEAALGETAAP